MSGRAMLVGLSLALACGGWPTTCLAQDTRDDPARGTLPNPSAPEPASGTREVSEPNREQAAAAPPTPAEVLGLASREAPPPIPNRRRMRVSLDACVEYLLGSQEPDGSWGSVANPADGFWSNIHTHRAWIAATTGLSLSALLEASEDPTALAAADRAIDFLTGSADLKRPSGWDTDHTWGLLYSLAGVNAALSHPRYAQGPRHQALLDLGGRCIEGLSASQSPSGGWGYYDLEGPTRRPSWATSFQTAAALLELLAAVEHGLEVPPVMIDASRTAVERCRLPSGAYTYSVNAIPSPGRATGINQVQGSLARTQVGNLALWLAGSEAVTRADLLDGLDLFFEHHRFLDIARGKPVPHEAYYQNSGYFYFFGHYYAARVMEQLAPAEQLRYRGRLAREIVKCQEADGSMWDFYLNTYHRAYGSAFGAMTLVRTLGREEP